MTSEERIGVMTVEDHFVVRAGLAEIINSQPDMLVVAEATGGLEALELFERHRPAVTLMDLRLPGLDGIAAIAEIVRRHPEARIIVISTYGGEEDVFRAIEAGARGYYLKHVDGKELVAAIRSVHAGERRLPPEIATRLADRERRVALSHRELEVLQLVARGRSTREVADALAISEGTVRVHVNHVLMKLGCSDKSKAVAEAYKQGIVHLDDAPAKPSRDF
jgi:DNA-binding NarL/FixJ family response regulator